MPANFNWGLLKLLIGRLIKIPDFNFLIKLLVMSYYSELIDLLP